MGYLDYAGLQYLWGKLKEKFAPKSHTHDDRYYTESEVDGKLSKKENSQLLTTVTDVNSLKTTGIYHCNAPMTNNATSNQGTLYVDFLVGTPYQIWMPDNQNTAYKRTFSGGVWTDWIQLKFTDTNTWRGIQNNLTSDSTSDSLSAAQGKVLKGLIDGKAPNEHTHSSIVGHTAGNGFNFGYSNSKDVTIPKETAVSTYYVKILSSTPFDFRFKKMYVKTVGDNTQYSFIAQVSANAYMSPHIELITQQYNSPEIKNIIVASAPNYNHSIYLEIDSSTKVAKTISIQTDFSTDASLSLSKIKPSDIQLTVPIRSNNHISTSIPICADGGIWGNLNGKATSAGTADVANSVDWSKVQNKPSSYTPASHTHDDRYYTEGEINSKLDGKSNTGHTHDDRYYTETEINAKLNGKANSSHTHTKSQITDFPASLKNPTALTIQTNGTTAATYDGSAAKTVNVTKGNIGLGNVDNTADANKSVKYATSAGSANTATKATTATNATMAAASKSLQLLSSDRPTSMNFNLSSADYNQKVTYAIASASTKEGKPPRDSLVSTYAWDNSGWGAQLAIDADSNPRMYVRGATNNNGASKWDANWKTVAFTDDKPAAAGTADNAIKLGDLPPSKDGDKDVWGTVPTVSSYTGVTELGKYIDFHSTRDSSVDYDVRITAETTGLTITGTTKGTFSGNLTGNASTATSATTASHVGLGGDVKNPMTFNWSGQSGQPSWLWGSNNGTDVKVWNPANFNVNSAKTATSATKATTADKAAKLTTVRNVSGGSDITLSFDYDGSGNSTANIGFYSCKHSIGNTNNYPFHRFAKLDNLTDAYTDKTMLVYITQDYNNGGFGICRLSLRTNNSSSASSVEAKWLIRSGLSADFVQVAIYNVYGKTYADAFIKINGTWGGTTISALESGGRANQRRTWTLVNSNEVDGTTTADKKTSSECWKTIAEAGTALHNQAYSSSAPATDNGHTASAGNADTASIATTGVRDYNNANNTIKIGWSGADLDANTLAYVAGYTSDMKIHTASKDGVRSWLVLGSSAYKKTQSLSAVGHSDWKNQSTDDNYVPTMAFMAFWNGAFSGSGSSNLQYCDRGRFGTIVTKNSGDYAVAGHTHNYAGSSSAGGSANSAVKLDTSAGSNTQPVYFSGGKPVAIGYTIAKSVPADAKFTDTNTWRGIQNNLISDSTDQSLSAAQGKALKTLVDGKAPTSHTHTKSQITDFPSSMPASDVSAWAKAATKPSYIKAEVGLSNVDNTADKDKSVKYATSATNATNTQYLNNDSQYMSFHWNGQSGQPTWLWGGNDANNMYVYNPSNFSVKYATSAGTALTAKNLPYSITYEGSYVGTAMSDSLRHTNDPNYATAANPVKTTLSREYDVVVFLDAGVKGRWDSDYDETCREKYAFLRLMNTGDLFIKSFVVMSALTSEWTRGLSGYQNSNNVNYGPVIQYEYSPKKTIKYRKNGTTIERYWTREAISTNGTIGEPGSASYIDNGANMLLDRARRTYHVFGIDIDHRFFTAVHAAGEGSEVV